MHEINIQRAAHNIFIPEDKFIIKWANAALENVDKVELTIRIVDVDEMTQLNEQFRHKKGPTNVLSFPFSIPKDVKLDIPILGDIIICAEIIQTEAKAQQKSLEAHWAHMIIHGTLHLQGYDHQNDHDAEKMEAIETTILNKFGFANPYEDRL